MIVNQVENGAIRTIDTKTGVYMTARRDHPLYPSTTFTFHIGKRVIYFGLVFEIDEDTQNPQLRRYIALTNAGIFNSIAEAEEYISILPTFIKVYHEYDNFGDGSVRYIVTDLRPKQVAIEGQGYVNV